MKAKALKGGWTYKGVTYRVGDEVDAPATQIAAWEATGYVERVAKKADTKEEIETAEAAPAPENAATRTSRPKWTLKTPPEEYLEQYPDGPNAELAREVIEAEDDS